MGVFRLQCILEEGRAGEEGEEGGKTKHRAEECLVDYTEPNSAWLLKYLGWDTHGKDINILFRGFLNT